MHPSLSFEQAPPISVPFRFLLTAPWFGVAAGLLLFLDGGDMFGSRWLPASLAVTHLLVAGFMLQAMLGALLQFVPVAAGGNIWRPRLVAGIVHPVLIVAVILLVAALLFSLPTWFVAAAHAFLLGIGLFVVAVGTALWRTSAQSPSILALRLSLLGLAVTLGLGATLALGRAYGYPLDFLLITDIHAAWGLGGWGLMLLMGVSYLVVPMFQLTPAYPALLARGLPWGLLVLLLLWSSPWGNGIATLLAGLAVGAVYATTTLWLQHRRRRKVSDTTLLFFRLSMASLLVLAASVLMFVLFPELGKETRAAIWVGMLALVGVFVSAINGMLYKIVPFLCWLHLQRLCGAGQLPPTMNQMIPAAAMRYQWFVHLAACGCLLGAVWQEFLARPAGLLFAASCAWLGINLINAARTYRRFKDHIRANV